MYTYKKTLLAAVAILCLMSCDDDYDEIQDGLNRTIEVSETLNSDVQSVERIQRYEIVGGELSRYLNTQRYSLYFNGNETEMYETTQETTSSYSDNEVTFTDSYGNVSVYYLNSMGYAERCERYEGGGSVRRYTFSYVNSDGRILLDEVSESIDGIGLFSSISLGYLAEDKMSIIHNMNGDMQSYVATMNLGEINSYELPLLFLAEMHPLNLHLAAFYSGLLGRPLKNLVNYIEPENNSEHNERITYIYTSNKSLNALSCNIRTKSDGTTYSSRNIVYNVNDIIE
jgi:hypothetical protein